MNQQTIEKQALVESVLFEEEEYHIQLFSPGLIPDTPWPKEKYAAFILGPCGGKGQVIQVVMTEDFVNANWANLIQYLINEFKNSCEQIKLMV